jgi:hypothetical protein
VIHPVRGEQEAERALRELLAGDGVLADEHLADEPADRAVARLARQVRLAAARAEVLDEAPRLRGGPGTVEALEHEQARHRTRF